MQPPNHVGRESDSKRFDWQMRQSTQCCCCDPCGVGFVSRQVNTGAEAANAAAYRRHDFDIIKSSSVTSSLSTCKEHDNNGPKIQNKPPENADARGFDNRITKARGTSNGSGAYHYNTGAPDDKRNLDSGYAWLILAIMFLLQSSISGSSRVYGLIYAKEVDIGYFDREEASWPISTASMVENLASILAPALVQFFSWRQIELTAGLLFVTSNLCAYFSNSLALDILCLGGIQGIALSLSTVLSLVINNDYFERYRTTAYGISMAGSTFGVLYLSPLVSWILDTCDDFRLAYLGFAGVFCMNVVLALFIKPRASTMRSHRSRPSSSTTSSHYGRGAISSCGDVSVIIDDPMGEGKLRRLRTSDLSRYDFGLAKQTATDCKWDSKGMKRSSVALKHDKDEQQGGKPAYKATNWATLDVNELWAGDKDDALLDSGQRRSVMGKWADIADSDSYNDSGSNADSVSPNSVCGSGHLAGSGAGKALGGECEKGVGTNCESRPSAAAAANKQRQTRRRSNWFGSARINHNKNGGRSNNNNETIANETSLAAADAATRRCSAVLRPLERELSIASVSDWAQHRRASIWSNMSQEKPYSINGRRRLHNQSFSTRRDTTTAKLERGVGPEKQRQSDCQAAWSARLSRAGMPTGAETGDAGAAGRQPRLRPPKHNRISSRRVSAEMYSESASGRKSILPNPNSEANPLAVHRSSTVIEAPVAASEQSGTQNTHDECPTRAGRRSDETSCRYDNSDASGAAAGCVSGEDHHNHCGARKMTTPQQGAFCWIREAACSGGGASEDPHICVVPLSSEECPVQGQVDCSGDDATKPATASMKFILGADRYPTSCCRPTEGSCGGENREPAAALAPPQQQQQSEQTTDCATEKKMSADGKEHRYCDIGSKAGRGTSIVEQHRCEADNSSTGGARSKFWPVPDKKTAPSRIYCAEEDIYLDGLDSDKREHSIDDDDCIGDYDYDDEDDNNWPRAIGDAHRYSPQQHDEPEEFNLTTIGNLLKSPYLHLTWMMLSLYYIVARVFVIILVDFAKDHSLSAESSMGLLNYWSLGELCGRLVLGSLIDLKWTSVRNCISITCFLLASALCAMALYESYIVYALCSAFVAALTSLEYMLINVLLVEYMGKQCVTGCYALASLISSVILFIRPIMIGFFRDRLGSYDGLLLLLSALSLVVALLFAIAEPICARYWSSPPATKSKSSIRSMTSRRNQSTSS